MDKVLLTVEEAAERLSIGRTKAYELVATGALESVTIGRSRRIPAGALDMFVAKLRQSGGLDVDECASIDRRYP